MIILLSILLGLALIGMLIMGFIIFNLLRKMEGLEDVIEKYDGVYNTMIGEYEEFYSALQKTIQRTIDNMRAIDLRGAFEADDEVGHTFKEMLRMVKSLDNIIDKEPIELGGSVESKEKK